MNKDSKIATIVGIFGNLFLFILKIFVGLLYNSIAVISDAINSLTDIIASVIVYISVRSSAKSADKEHPFGHYRAEPIAGLIVAIFTGIVGFEVIKFAFERLIAGGVIIRGIAPMVVMAFTLFLKSGMYIYTRHVGKKVRSTAIIASSIDHRNDVIISIGALIGVTGSYFGYPIMDPIVALFIGVWIVYAGYKIGLDNLKFLIGEAPSEELLERIRKTALSVDSVRGVHDVRAHYVGVVLHVEVHILVDRNLTTYRTHTIGKKVQGKLEKLKDIDRVFVHIDPTTRNNVKKR